MKTPINRVDQFRSEVISRFQFEVPTLLLGSAILDNEPVSDTPVRLPLRMFNRHGLIAGATGTGKTKTLQVLAERLSEQGVPSLMMDIKGDLSGIAAPGEEKDFITKRQAWIGETYQSSGCPVELMSLSRAPGVRLRATVSEFGPLLFSKMLGLNDTQTGMVSIVFKYADDHRLPLIDLDDFRAVINYVSGPAKSEIETHYGRMASTSVGTILRKLLELEQQKADDFFGEPSFQVADLCRTTTEGRGVVSILRLMDVQDKPKLFSSFMLGLMAEIFAEFPELGDPDRPRLVLFIDEAHLVFQEASKELLAQLETVIKLIRSKGVGIYFCTQSPTDIPEAILGQLGLKIQHSLRAFTAKDRKAIKSTAENYPLSHFYQTDVEITSLGIGEALVVGLDPKGRPTPLVRTLLCAPRSRMDVLSTEEQNHLISQSLLAAKYNTDINPHSAFEILQNKLQAAAGDAPTTQIPAPAPLPATRDSSLKEALGGTSRRSAPRRAEKSMVEQVLTSTTARQVARTAAREITRGLLGVLGVKASSRSRR
ncbi:MAG: helicase HerA-like domain-containing protein [Candidatus Methylacidiphilales bacterium]